MKRMFGSAVGMALASCALQGCLASTVVLRVKPDGSGTAVATLRVNRAAMQDFERVLGAPMGPKTLEDRYPQPDNSALEKFFGTRVTLVSSTLTPTADGFARETIVAFDDVTKVQLPCPLFVDSMTPGHGPLSVQELLWRLGDLPGALTPVEREVFLEFEPPTQSTPAPSQSPSRPAAPDTEIFLAPLTVSGQHIAIGQPVNISNSPGYDNQPSFTPDGQRLLFTSARGGAQTDIYRYDLASKQVTQVTNTPESEYSPTVTPDHGLSVVRVEADGTQRLWRFTSDGGDPRVLLENVKPVGYHAWSDDHTLVLYILGQPGTTQTSTLQVADLRTNSVRSIAADIGRSLLPIPGGHRISFVQRSVQGEKTMLSINELDPATGAIRPLTPAVEGTTEVNAAWTADAALLTIQADHLFAWRRGGNGWIDVAALDRLGLRGATRLAVSPDSHWIAIVASPQ